MDADDGRVIASDAGDLDSGGTPGMNDPSPTPPDAEEDGTASWSLLPRGRYRPWYVRDEGPSYRRRAGP